MHIPWIKLKLNGLHCCQYLKLLNLCRGIIVLLARFFSLAHSSVDYFDRVQHGIIELFEFAKSKPRRSIVESINALSARSMWFSWISYHFKRWANANPSMGCCYVGPSHWIVYSKKARLMAVHVVRWMKHNLKKKFSEFYQYFINWMVNLMRTGWHKPRFMDAVIVDVQFTIAWDGLIRSSSTSIEVFGGIRLRRSPSQQLRYSLCTRSMIHPLNFL